MEKQYENELIPIAMQIIIHAGDAQRTETERSQ